MLSRKATAILLVVHAATMLASQTEAFVPIFTYSEVQRMQEKEKYKGQKKSLSVQQRSEEVGPVDLSEPWEENQEVIKCMKVKPESEVAQSYLTLRDPMDCSLPGSSVHGIFQLTAPVEIGMRMNSRLLEKYQATLEGLLCEVLPSSRNAAQ